MKVLFIGGTGNISRSASLLALTMGVDLYLLNRGKRISPSDISSGSSPLHRVKHIICDIYNPSEVAKALNGHKWDAVVNWIAFTEADIRRDFELFRGKTKQYIFISSASIYQKPLAHPVITESTPLANPYWQYSRDKIACELLLNSLYRDTGFPCTIVRPSHTYDIVIPVPIGGSSEYTTVDRIKKGKKIIVHGDGSSLWTLTHSEDFAKGFAGLLGNYKALGHAFHITSDEILTWDQIHLTIAEALGRDAKIVHIPSDLLALYNKDLHGGLLGDKSASVIFDNSKIRQFVPDYKATIPFTEGIKRTLDWFEEDSARRIINEETNSWIDNVISRFEKSMP